MSLRLIYGKSGTGKSKFIFNEIKENINKKNKIYIITPEQFSFTTEKRLLQELNEKSIINAQVLSFERMAHQVFHEVGGVAKNNISQSGKAMLLYYLIEKQKKSLKFLVNSNENVDIIFKIISELKKCSIPEIKLENFLNNSENTYLNLKISDINVLYKEYNKFIENQYLDEDDNLTILAKKIDETCLFDDSLIYIDEFSNFTEQEYIIIEKLLEKAKQINITLCTDRIEDNLDNYSDIFFSNKQTANRLIEIAKQQHKVIDKSIELTQNQRFKNEELKHLEENMYSTKYKQYNSKVDSIKLSLSMNPYDEIESIAQKIIQLVRNKKYRFNEIAIIAQNIDDYGNITKAIFGKYKIPVFIDEKKELNQNILIKFILSVIEVLTKNWSLETVFSYIKTGFIDLEKIDMYKLENYCIKWGIKGKKWLENWNYEDENTEYLNIIRKQIVDPLLKLKQNLDFDGNKASVKAITTSLYNFLIENHINENFNKKIENMQQIGEIEIANEYITSFNVVIQLLDEIVQILGEERITFEKYKEIFKIGTGNCDVGKIPATLDQVILGNVDRSRNNNIKVLFIVGMNDGVFPKVNKDEGFLCDIDRENLKLMGIKLQKNTLERAYEDQFNIYKLLSLSEEKIYISYVSSDNKGTTLRPSVLITKIKKIFKNLKEESNIIIKNNEIYTDNITFNELILNLRNFVNGEEIDRLWFDVYNWYNNNSFWKDTLQQALKELEKEETTEKINEENIEQLYGQTLQTSVSKLEQYKKCPFSYYLQYGLRIDDRPELSLKPIDTGSFMHEVIEEFFKELDEKEIKIKEIDYEELKKIISEIIDKKLCLKKNYKFTSTPKFIILTNKLRRVIMQSITYIVEQLKNSSFEIFETEVEFSKNSKYQPITMQLDNNKKVEIIGKIDRIDIAKNENGKYIRIIDYKSSVKDIDLNEVVTGLQVQLVTYLDAITEKQDVLPAGVLYFNLIDPIIKADKNLTEEEIEKEIRKNFKMNGLVLADINVVKMMDKSLEKGYSQNIPVNIDKDGNISKKSNVVTEEEFSKLQKKVKETIKQISNEILKGNIDIKPTYNTKTKCATCDYCKYKTICNFNQNEGQYNYINTLTNEEILKTL